MNHDKPMLRVLDPERHVDTEPVAEYWYPVTTDTEPAWVDTYRSIASGAVGVASIGVPAYIMGSVASFGEHTATGSFDVAAKQAVSAVPGFTVALLVGIALYELAMRMQPRELSPLKQVGVQVAWVFLVLILGMVVAA